MKHQSKRRAWLLAATTGAVLASWPAHVWAARLMTGDITETVEAVAGDAYLFGNTVTIRHDVRDDAFVVGNSVSVSAATGGDVVAAGNSVRLTGAVGDDIAAAGHDVDLHVPRADEIFVAGARVAITSQDVAGAVYAAGSRVQLSGTFNGTVRVAGEEITVVAGSTIRGDFISYGEREPVIKEGVTILGERRHHTLAEQRNSWALAGVMISQMLTWFVSGFVLLWLFRQPVVETAQRVLAQSGRALGMGAFTLVLVLPLSVALLFTRVAWPLAWILLTGAGMLFVIAHLIAALVVGTWLDRVMQKSAPARLKLIWQQLLVGVIILQLLQLVPLVGWLASGVVTIMAFGTLVDSIWRHMRAGLLRVETETRLA